MALRLRNDIKLDERTGLPVAGRHFAECLRMGAEAFGCFHATGRRLREVPFTQDKLLL
jgi:CO/xanthine dehydrogenase Mo-binding subunit